MEMSVPPTMEVYNLSLLYLAILFSGRSDTDLLQSRIINNP